MADEVSKRDVIAFRLGAHRLTERLGGNALLDAAGQCAVQNSPPGSALLALHARVRNLTQEQVTEAVAEEKSLLQTCCIARLAVLLPCLGRSGVHHRRASADRGAMRHFVVGVERVLDKLEMSMTETVELVGAEIAEVLSGRQLAINELGAEIARRVARELPKRQRDIWEEEGPYAPGSAAR